MHHLQELLPREETSMENKITFDNENGTPSGASSSFQANGQSHSLHIITSILPIELFCEITLATLS
jgi:hypothetical protein